MNKEANFTLSKTFGNTQADHTRKREMQGLLLSTPVSKMRYSGGFVPKSPVDIAGLVKNTVEPKKQGDKDNAKRNTNRQTSFSTVCRKA
ncbi:hypothetical protein M3J09_013835 [Ascochyta lentis]